MLQSQSTPNPKLLSAYHIISKDIHLINKIGYARAGIMLAGTHIAMSVTTGNSTWSTQKAL